MNWIPISERLPQDKLEYICRAKCPCHNENLNWGIYRFDGEKFNSDNITHWLEVTGPEECCEWKYDDFHSYYERTCLPEDPYCISTYEGLSKNNMNHCPNCGRKIKEVK